MSYTKMELEDTVRKILLFAGFGRTKEPKLACEAYMKSSGLPGACKQAAVEIFMHGLESRGLFVNEAVLVREALFDLGNEGFFRFQDSSEEGH